MNTVLLLVLPWADRFDDPRSGHVAKVVRQADGHLDLNLWLRAQRPDGSELPNRVGFSVPVQVGLADWPNPADPTSIRTWGLEKIGPGVWVLSPSVFRPEFHAYVVLRDVPENGPL